MKSGLLLMGVGWCEYFTILHVGRECEVIEEGTRFSREPLAVRSRPAIGSPPYDTQQVVDTARIIEVSGTRDRVAAYVARSCPRRRVRRSAEINHPYEVRRIRYSGDPANRIDVVFMGDGYTRDEKGKFFADVERLVSELLRGEPFAGMAPILNFWAIHVESPVSGIGWFRDGGTPFGLHRMGGQLRGIYPTNTRLAREMCRLTGKHACDFPALLANDEYMGGMGGEFIISASSNRSGILGLRHEMGHNFGDFGEEYDNGWAYEGANSSPDLSSIGWKRWLSGPLREERAVYRILEYPWHDLATPFVRSFCSSGNYSRWWLVVSVTSAKDSDALQFRLDNTSLPWKSKGHNDREFYEWKSPSPIRRGCHTLAVRSVAQNTHHVPRMLGSITLHELGSPQEFNASNHHYSAYPTWNQHRVKSYRPTHYGCAMRNMTGHAFCSVCMEAMWLNMLKKVSLIEEVSFQNNTIRLSTLRLGQLRPRLPVDSLIVRWYHQSFPQPHVNDRFEIESPPRGSWRVSVHLKSNFIRIPDHPATADHRSFQI